MSDVLIRDVPEEVVKAINARASRLGVSRVEYLRRRLIQDASAAPMAVTAHDLQSFGDLLGPF